MSKLADLIKRVGRREPEPMGFGTSARKAQPTMLLAAIAGERWARATADAIDAGADLVLLTGRPTEKDTAEAVAAAKDKSCGVLAGEAAAEQLVRLHEGGLDFAVLGPSAPAAATVDQKLSLVFQMRDDLTDIQLRALEGLPFDAIYLDRPAAPATIMRLVELQRIAGLARKPLLVHIAPDSRKNDLVALRDAGVVLVGIDMGDRNATDALRALRGTIDALPRRRVRGEDRASVALPRAHSEAEEEEDEDE
jgi:hypothetical protein